MSKIKLWLVACLYILGAVISYAVGLYSAESLFLASLVVFMFSITLTIVWDMDPK